MGKLNKALDQIAKFTQTDADWARKFCLEVQGACHVAPPFQAIADALEYVGLENLSVQAVASIASELHGLDIVDPKRSEDDTLDGIAEHDLRQEIQDDKSVQSATRALIDQITGRVLSQVLSEPIEGKVIAFTGSGPYDRDVLEGFAQRLGAIPDQPDFTWALVDWIVVGRSGYARDYLERSTEAPDLEYFSQEEFLGLVLFGERAFAEGGLDPQQRSHEGLRFVEFWLHQNEKDRLGTSSGNGGQGAGYVPDDGVGAEAVATEDVIWPSFGEGSEEPLQDTNGWSEESELRKLGYSVAKGVSVLRRQNALDLGVRNLGLRRVVGHVAWLIQMNRNNPRRYGALSNWRQDLDWLRSRYGNG